MIDFLRYRFACIIGSWLFFLAGAGALVYYGGFSYSVDFTGGTQVLFKFNKPVGSEDLKKMLEAVSQDPVIREFSPLEVAVRVKDFQNDTQGLAQKMRTSLEAQDAQLKVEILEANAVGSGVGGSLRYNAVVALLLSLLIVLLYIAVRFMSVPFAVGAVVSLFHDALAIVAVFAILQKEISPNVIGAILASLAYSINDTIVIFSRIKENFIKMKDKSAVEVANISINQTLRRTILTSFATLLVVIAMLLFGGESLHTLSLALFVGIIFGTYSSIYIASPIMLMLKKD